MGFCGCSMSVYTVSELAGNIKNSESKFLERSFAKAGKIKVCYFEQKRVLF